MINYKRSEELLGLFDELKSAVLLGVKDVYTIQEACEILGVSRTKFWHFRKEGHLKAKVIGKKKVIITREALNDFVRRSDDQSFPGISNN